MKEASIRVIKRYANRKLYDTRESRYVTLDQIADMIRNGEEVNVIDNNSKEDLTSVTLAQIIFEEEKKQRSFLPLSTLRNIIQSGGESIHELVSQISESAERVGRVFRHDSSDDNDPGEKTATGSSERTEPTKLLKEFMEGVQSAIDDWQTRLDANIQHALSSVSPLASLQKEIRALRERIDYLEQKLNHLEDTSAPNES